jgi:hypothetical protein
MWMEGKTSAAPRYRSIFHSAADPGEAFRVARDEMRHWVDSKDLSVDAFDAGEPVLGPGAVLVHLEQSSADGARTARWQLRENRPAGEKWISTLLVHVPPGGRESMRSWFWVDVENVVRQGVPRRPAVPKLMRSLLDAADAYDGPARLRARPTVIRPDEVEELINVVCEPDRRGAVLVATPLPDRSFEATRELITDVTRPLIGRAAIYLLDPLAEARFAAEIGTSHAVWRGAIRTYLPAADPASDADALRHRTLSFRRLIGDTREARRLLTGLPTTLAAESALPRPLAGVTRRLLPEAGGPPSSAESAEPDAVPRAEYDRLRGDYEAALNLVDEAAEGQQQAAELRAELDEMVAGLSRSSSRETYLEDQIRSLRTRLVDAGRAADAFLPPDTVTELPDSFAALLDRWRELGGTLVFTGDRRKALSLDDFPQVTTWVPSAWRILLAMRGFAEHKVRGEFDRDFKYWCDKPIGDDAPAVAHSQVIRDESSTVRNHWSNERTFPVPAKVDPTGRIYMGAHVRIGQGGQAAPRLHYHDALLVDGHLYVGYIGPHLTNTKTS